MVPPFLKSQDKARIGNDAGWVLEFYQERSGNLEPHPDLRFLRVDDYYADIQAELVGCENNNLRSGVYTFIIEGLIDKHYGILSLNNPKRPTVVKLYLYWRDTIASVGGYLSSFAGLTDLTSKLSDADLQDALVAVLSIKRVSRKAGSRRYETTIQAEEKVFSALNRPVTASVCMESPRSVLQAIQQRTDIQIRFNESNAFTSKGFLPSRADTNPATELAYLERGKTYAETIHELANAMEVATKKYGRGMLLIRDGNLYFGPRDIPFILGSDPEPLKLENGLIEPEIIGTTDSDPYFDRSSGDAPRLTKFKLTLKGRPDLKPGDLVKFNLPPEDAAKTTSDIGAALLGIAGPIAPVLDGGFANAVTLYVNSVKHQLSRTSGFVTYITGVSIPSADEAWDSHSPGGSRPTSSSSFSPVASGSTAAAQAVQQIAQRAAGSRYFAEVGEVRQVQTQGRGSQSETPGQTLTIWRGLVAPDGRANQSSRLSIQRPNPLQLPGVAYATPFAWGKCGLVLPRYPGTRVMMVHRNGQGNDPVEMGALWEAGHGPDSESGDWWLILPVDVDKQKRSAIADDATPEEHTSKVSQDLIDAEGNRIIEVGELTIRVGKDSLKNAGERPTRPSKQNCVTIEHTKKGAKIVIDADGNIEINAGNDGDITMTAKNVNINANDVKVKVQNAMDVS